MADGYGLALVGGEGLDFGAEAGDDGGADEDAGDVAVEALHGEGVFKAVDLGAEGVAADGDVEEGEGVLGSAVDFLGLFDLFGHEDHAHAGSPDREALGGAVLNGFAEAVAGEEEADSGGFAAGDDEAVDGLEMFGSADFEDLKGGVSEALKGLDVFVEVALEGEDADGLGHRQGGV